MVYEIEALYGQKLRVYHHKGSLCLDIVDESGKTITELEFLNDFAGQEASQLFDAIKVLVSMATGEVQE